MSAKVTLRWHGFAGMPARVALRWRGCAGMPARVTLRWRGFAGIIVRACNEPRCRVSAAPCSTEFRNTRGSKRAGCRQRADSILPVNLARHSSKNHHVQDLVARSIMLHTTFSISWLYVDQAHVQLYTVM